MNSNMRSLLRRLVSCIPSAAVCIGAVSHNSVAAQVDDWNYLPSWGWTYVALDPWFWQGDLGWVFSYSGLEDNGAWIYSENVGWAWSPSDRSYLYSVAFSAPGYISFSLIGKIDESVVQVYPGEFIPTRDNSLNIVDVALIGQRLQVTVEYQGEGDESFVIFAPSFLAETVPLQAHMELRMLRSNHSGLLEQSAILEFDLSEQLSAWSNGQTTSMVVSVHDKFVPYAIPAAEPTP